MESDDAGPGMVEPDGWERERGRDDVFLGPCFLFLPGLGAFVEASTALVWVNRRRGELGGQL